MKHPAAPLLVRIVFARSARVRQIPKTFVGLVKLDLHVNHAAVERVEACRDEDCGERVPTPELVDVHSLSSAKKHGEWQNRTDKFTHAPPPII